MGSEMCIRDSSSLTFMLKYSRALQAKILSHVKEDGSRTIDSFLQKLNEPIVTELEIKQQRPRGRDTRDTRPDRDTRDTRKRRFDDKRTSEDTPQKRPRGGAQLNLTPRVAAPAAKGAAKPPSSSGICFFHHPAQNKTCSRDRCSFTHLDTTQKSGLERYEKALASYKGSAKPRDE